LDAAICPLCSSKSCTVFFKDSKRAYLTCATCALIHVPSKYYLSDKDEKIRYDLHRNDPNDPEYRYFLNQLANPLLQRLTPNSVGLDFGCGPGPTLSLILTEAGMSMDIFDKFYASDPSVFIRQYDFVTATEVLEHLSEPMIEITRLWQCLKPGGYLGAMTQMVSVINPFERWRYKDDPTHICFFKPQTISWLAAKLAAGLELQEGNVFILRKL
jgi:SAM-dependent methyltransferase